MVEKTPLTREMVERVTAALFYNYTNKTLTLSQYIVKIKQLQAKAKEAGLLDVKD